MQCLTISVLPLDNDGNTTYPWHPCVPQSTTNSHAAVLTSSTACITAGRPSSDTLILRTTAISANLIPISRTLRAFVDPTVRIPAAATEGLAASSAH